MILRTALTTKWQVYDILRPYVLPFMVHHPRGISQYDNTKPRISLDCLRRCLYSSLAKKFIRPFANRTYMGHGKLPDSVIPKCH